MRETLKLSLLLAVVAAVCGGLLVAVANKTAAARGAVAQRRTEAALNSLFGSERAASGAFVPLDGLDAYALVGDAAGVAPQFLGAAIRATSTHGYGGNIALMAAFDADGRLIDFAVLDAHETPGLGAKIARPEFRRGFAGRLFSGPWKLRKDGGDIDAVTSATISSRAATEAIADAASRFESVRAAALRQPAAGTPAPQGEVLQ